jgi:hypothetical protein
MKQRGRRSRESLSVVPIDIDGQRPPPPADLTAEEANVWISTVRAMKAGWFTPEAWPLLARYCRHAVLAQMLGQAIEKEIGPKRILPDNLDRFRKLRNMHASEGAMMVRLATKMRLTPHSRTRADTSALDPSGGRPKPWD